MSLLKNLSLPHANKEIIGKTGVLDVAKKFLSTSYSHVQPLQFASVGVYKHLCTQQRKLNIDIIFAIDIYNSVDNTLAMINTSALNSILELINKSDDTGIKSEGTRILVNAIKTCWQIKDSKSEEAKKSFINSLVIKALLEMIRHGRKYQICKNENNVSL